MIKRILSSLLCLIVLGTILSSAFAEEQKSEYDIVAIGDSTTIGQGNNDFGIYRITDHILTGTKRTYQTVSLRNYGYLSFGSAKAYPALLADYLSETMTDYDVKFTNLGISGIRAEEILSIINGENETGRSLLENLYHYVDEYVTEPETGLRSTALFNREINNAELITLDCVMNSYTEPLFGRMSDLITGNISSLDELKALKYNHEDFDKLLGSMSSELTKEPVLSFYSAISKLCSGIDLAVGTRLIEDCFCDFCYNFNALVQRIRELNPDARLVVCGTYNPFYDMNAEIGGVTIDIGKIMSSYLALSDLYMSELSPERNEYIFVDLPDNIETYREYFAEAGDVWGVSPINLSRILDSLYGEHPWKYFDPLFDRVREEGEKRGIDTDSVFEPYDKKAREYLVKSGLDPNKSAIFADTVDEAFADVRANGEDALPVNKLVADVYSKYLDTIIGSFDLKTIDYGGYLTADIMSFNELVLSLMDTPKEEMSKKERSALFCACMESIRDGMGAHYSEEGCRVKFELVKAALEAEEEPPLGDKLGDEIKSNARSFVQNTVQTNFSNKFNKVFEIIRSIIESFTSIFFS